MVLVANSGAVTRGMLEAMPDDTLFVFFNRVFKILDGPFDRPSLLVTRCSIAGPNLVHRGEQGTVLPLLAGPQFHGVVQLRAVTGETFGGDDAFAPHPVGRIDLSGWFEGAYPAGDVPTSGFALATWLLSARDGHELVLAGFDAERSDRWKLFDDHNWTFEQIVLRSLAEAGRLSRVPSAPSWPLLAMLERTGIDGLDPVVAAAVLAERQRGTSVRLDRVWSAIAPLRALDRTLRRLKPRTRKERIAEARDQAKGG